MLKNCALLGMGRQGNKLWLQIARNAVYVVGFFFPPFIKKKDLLRLQLIQ